MFCTALTPDQPNILMEDSGCVLIADFGLANITKNPGSVPIHSVQKGLSFQWASPEVWERDDYSKKADVFSFAMVMIEVHHR